MIVGRGKTVKIIRHDFEDYFIFLVFFLHQQALNNFSINSEVTPIFQCLMKHFIFELLVLIYTYPVILFVIMHLVLETFSQGAKLEISASHSLEHSFGAMPVSISQLRAEIAIFHTNLLNIFSDLITVLLSVVKT